MQPCTAMYISVPCLVLHLNHMRLIPDQVPSTAKTLPQSECERSGTQIHGSLACQQLHSIHACSI